MISILGVDGSGKSHLATQIQGQKGLKVRVLRATDYHLSPLAEVSDLSWMLSALSNVADERKSYELKGISLFLKMMLFTKARKNLLSNSPATIEITARHPVIDFMVYSPFYQTMMQTERLSQELFFALKNDNTFDALWGYFDTEIKEKVGVSFKDLPQFLIELSRQSQAWDPNTFHTLETLFDCPLPKAVVYINIPSQEHQDRLSQRKSLQELHERQKVLQNLHSRYVKILDLLSPGIEVHFHASFDDTCIFISKHGTSNS